MKRILMALVMIAILAATFWLGHSTATYFLFRETGMTKEQFLRTIPEIAKMAHEFNPSDEDARTMYVINDLASLILLERGVGNMNPG